MDKELKTSEEWYPIVQKQWEEFENKQFIIYDPDGWDRKNYQYSWHEELITEEEFSNRVFQSTCMYKRLKNENAN
jgi:hypothetical protein